MYVDMTATILLVIHITAGSLALLFAIVPVVTQKGGIIHIRAGRVYALGMTVVFLTAVPLAIIGSDIFLLIIAMFSFYLVFAGWRFARNRDSNPIWIDWLAVSIMALTGLGMWVYGVILATSGDTQWIPLAVFGFIALGLSWADFNFHRSRTESASGRIPRHLTNMLAGTIATVTAVAVVNGDNLSMVPTWVTWIAPTVVITPLIVWWNIRVRRQQKART